METKILIKVLLSADTVIAIDQPSYNTLANYGFRSLYYLPNPLSINIIQQIEKDCKIIKRIKNKILFVGHVIPSKGVIELIEACKGLEGTELHYIGTFDEDIQKVILQKARSREGGEWVKLHGPKPHNEVIKEMLSCDVFVLPSYTEGFPNVILEAMACGCAIVATNVGAIPEMLDMENGNQYGVLVKPKDSKDLHCAIKLLLDNCALNNSIGNNALCRVKERYVISKVWDELEAIWGSIS